VWPATLSYPSWVMEHGQLCQPPHLEGTVLLQSSLGAQGSEKRCCKGQV
jgi:hypothetical protein